MGKLTFEQLLDLQIICSVDRIGPAKIRNLLKKFKSISNILSAKTNELIEAEGISYELAKRIRNASGSRSSIEQKLQSDLNTLASMNGEIISVWDENYPFLLKKIYDPPLLLYVKGEIRKEDKFTIAVVGTRVPTAYGKQQAEFFASELAAQGIIIVSGLARGIDSIAHKSSIKSGGRTYAVIGSGLDVIYPPENRKLFEDITENGAVISEFSPGTKPDAVNFPRRNRIISGLSLGSLIVETGISGGAMQTASLSLDQNREVFAIPGNLGVKQAEGNNLLIQKGEAELVIKPEDILLDLGLKVSPQSGVNIPKPKVELNLFEEKIMEHINSQPLHIDKLSQLTDLSTSDCLVHLLSLEFKGLVKQLPGKNFQLV